MALTYLSVLLVGLAVRCMAQDEPSYLCNKTSADANGTFFYSYNPHVNQGPQAGQPDNNSGQTLEVGVGLTLLQNFETNKVEYSLWYDTNGANYKNDTGLGYDVCAISWSPTPYETQVRGQADNGSCYSMFDQACITAVERAASQYALQFYESVTGQSNASSSISSPLSLICGDIATSLNANLPQECAPYVNGSSSFAPSIPLTGSSSPVYAFNCPMNGTMNGTESTYNLLQTKEANFSSQAYDGYGTYAWPLLAVWMPVSTGESADSINTSVAGMICGRIDTYTSDSIVPTPLKSRNPPSNNNLSGGAIAGIVIGSVVGAALILAFIAWYILRRRKSRTPTEILEKDGENTLHEASTNETMTKVTTVGSLSEAPDTAISELPPEWVKRSELNAGKENEVFELPSAFNEYKSASSSSEESSPEGRDREGNTRLGSVEE